VRIVGIDVGKKRDPSALMAIEGDFLAPRRKITAADRLPLGMDYVSQTEAMDHFCAGSDLVVVDCTGVGQAVVDGLIDRKIEVPIWGMNITGGRGTRINWDHRTVFVPKRTLIEHTAVAIEKGILGHDVKEVQHKRTLDVLWDELRHFERRGQSIEAALGRHDDLVIALALAMFGFIIKRMERDRAA